jgi:hypothetical protein
MNSASLMERAGTGRSWNPKVACALALGLVFLCGAASGALVMDFRVHNRNRVPAASFDSAASKAMNFEHMQKELDLTPAQSEQIQSVLSDFWQYYRTVLSDSKQRVEQLLTDSQKLKFEKMLQQPAAK